MERKLLFGCAIALNLVISLLYLLPLRRLPVWDFPQFYFAGELVRSGRISELYNRAAYQPLIAELRGVDERAARQSTYFNRPAFEAPLFVPLALFPYRTASFLMIAINLLLVGVLVWKLTVWFRAPAHNRVWLFVFMPFLFSVALGQDTLLLTLAVAYGIHLASKKHDGCAGAVLALAAFKPHLVWAIPFALAAGRKWKMLATFLATGVSLAALSLGLVGVNGLRQWADLLRAPTTDYMPVLMGNVRALGLLWGPIPGIVAALAVVLSFAFILMRGSFNEKLSAALLVALLLSPHTYLQDYSLLAIVALSSLSGIARYAALTPWPYFYQPRDQLPLIVLAIGCLLILAAGAAVRCRAGVRAGAQDGLGASRKAEAAILGDRVTSGE